MPEHAEKGRPTGSRNKSTAELMALAGEGESPVEFGLRIMRDEGASLEQRLHAARLAAPYLCARPAPAAEPVTLDLPEIDTVGGVTTAGAAVLRAVASGRINSDVGRDLISMIDVQRKSLELVEIERRLVMLERAKAEEQTGRRHAHT